MSKRLAFIRSIRDIAQGLEKALVEINNGTPPEAVRSYIISQLSQNPVFWEIFSTNTYTELMGLVLPFNETGGVRFDYQFLTRPEVASLCSDIINDIHNKPSA
jgi:hypothetical protein